MFQNKAGNQSCIVERVVQGITGLDCRAWLDEKGDIVIEPSQSELDIKFLFITLRKKSDIINEENKLWRAQNANKTSKKNVSTAKWNEKSIVAEEDELPEKPRASEPYEKDEETAELKMIKKGRASSTSEKNEESSEKCEEKMDEETTEWKMIKKKRASATSEKSEKSSEKYEEKMGLKMRPAFSNLLVVCQERLLPDLKIRL